MMKFPLIVLAIAFSVSLHANESIVSTPEEIPSVLVSSGKSTPKAECRKSTLAEVYTVSDLSLCGKRIDNSGLGGVFNRAKRCSVEKIVAEVFAAPCTCEDCAAKQRAQEIRCAQRNACTCQDEAYVKSLVTDLMDGSRRVRNAAMRGLRQCGFRVEHERACVDAVVPSAIFH